MGGVDEAVGRIPLLHLICDLLSSDDRVLLLLQQLLEYLWLLLDLLDEVVNDPLACSEFFRHLAEQLSLDEDLPRYLDLVPER